MKQLSYYLKQEIIRRTDKKLYLSKDMNFKTNEYLTDNEIIPPRKTGY